MTASKTFPQGLTDGTPITSGNSSTGSQSSMTITPGSGNTLQADTGIGAFDSQGGVGETWLLVHGAGASACTATYAVSEAANCADKATHQWATAMPGVIDRIIDMRNSTATACKLEVSATGFPTVSDTTGIIATGTTVLTPGVEYRFELAITVSAGSATVNWGVYLGNNPVAITGNSGSLSGANTGSSTIVAVNHISGATSTGPWGKNVGAFQHASQSTLIGPVSGGAIPVNLVMPACSPVFSTGRGSQIGIRNFGAGVTFLGGRSPVLSIGGVGSVHFTMPPSKPTFLSGRNPVLGGVTPVVPATPPLQSRNSLLYDVLELNSGGTGTFSITTGNRDLGDPVAVSDTVASDFIDGQLVTGTFLGNRQIVLSVLILTASRTALSAATEALMSLVYDPTPHTLTWSPLGGLPLVFDTYRGDAVTTWSGQMEAQFARVVQITLPAAPTGRSMQRETIAGSSGAITVMDFSNPAAFTYVRPSGSDATVYPNLGSGNPALVASVPMPTIGTNNGPITANPYPVAGAASTQIDARAYCWQAASTVTYGGVAGGAIGGGTTTTVALPARGEYAARITSGVLALDLRAATNLQVPIFVAASSLAGLTPVINAYVTLTDSHGVSATFALAETQQGGNNNWSFFSLDLTTATTLDLAHIVKCALTVGVGPIYDYTTGMPTVPVVIGKMQAFPATSTLVTTTRGSVLRFSNVIGSAPAPVSFAVDRGGSQAMSGILFYRAPFGTPLTTPILLPLVSGVGTTVAPSTFDGTYRLIVATSAAEVYGATIQQNLNGVPMTDPNATFTTKGGVFGGVAFGNNYTDLGEVTLPLVDVPQQVTGVTYTITYAGSSAGTEIIFADTTGRLLWVPQFTPVNYITADEATAAALGGVWGGQLANGSDAQSLLGNTVPPQLAALTLASGDNYLLVHCPDGVPSNIKATYAPRWFAERSA